MKGLVGSFNQKKALVGSRGLLRDYEPLYGPSFEALVEMMKTWWRCCSDLSVPSCGVPSNDESPDWGRGFTLQLPAGHCHQPNIVLMKAVNSFMIIQPRDYPELWLRQHHSYKLSPASCPGHLLNISDQIHNASPACVSAQVMRPCEAGILWKIPTILRLF